MCSTLMMLIAHIGIKSNNILCTFPNKISPSSFFIQTSFLTPSLYGGYGFVSFALIAGSFKKGTGFGLDRKKIISHAIWPCCENLTKMIMYFRPSFLMESTNSGRPLNVFLS